MSKIVLFQEKKAQETIKKITEITFVPLIYFLLSLTLLLMLTGLIASNDLEVGLLAFVLTVFAMPLLLSVGKEPPRTDLVSLLLSPLVLGSVLLPTVSLDVALETISVLVLIALGTLLTGPFRSKSWEIFVPLIINSLVFLSRSGVINVYQGAIAIVLTLTSVLMAMFRNVTESINGMDRVIVNVFVIAIAIAELEAGPEITNLITDCVVKIMESPSTRFVYVPAMSVVATLAFRAPAHVTFVSMVVTVLTSLLVIFYQRELLKRPGQFTGIISFMVSVALVLVNSFSLHSVLLTVFGLNVLFAVKIVIPNLLSTLQYAIKLFQSMWRMYCVMIRPNRCTDCFNLFFPEFVALIGMTTGGCSPFAIYKITSLTIICKRVHTGILWNYSSTSVITLLIYFTQFLILLIVVSNIRTFYGSLFVLLVRHILVSPLALKVVTFVPLLITLFAMETTSLFMIVLLATGLILLYISVMIFIYFKRQSGEYCLLVFIPSFVIGILITGITSLFAGLISSFACMLCCLVVSLKVSFESKAWALILTAGLGVSVWLAPTEEIATEELVALVAVISIILETNTAPWPKQCLSK